MMNSLEHRLQIGLGLGVIILVGLMWLAGNQSVRNLTEKYVITRLEHDAETILTAIDPMPGMRKVRWRRITQVYNQPFSGHYFILLFSDGEVLTSRSLGDHSVKLSPLEFGAMEHNHFVGPKDQKLLLISQGLKKQGIDFTLGVAEDISPLQHEQDKFLQNFALIALLGLFGLLVLQSIVVRRSMRRLNVVREDIKALEKGAKDKLSDDVPSEIYPLVDEFNHLLGLLGQRLERSRNALGNLAHALKGPLNLLTQHLDSDESAFNLEERKQARIQAQRIHKLMDRELNRARIAGSGVATSRFNPPIELPDLVGLLNQMHKKRGLEISYHVDDLVSSFGDREDMLELFGNLLDNACKWASDKVYCSVTKTNNQVQIVIEDDGTSLNQELLRDITKRGVRMDELIEGHGLGLAIVKDIVNLYGGNMAFSQSEKYSGLHVEVNLPLQSVKVESNRV